MSRARDLSKLGNPNVIKADTTSVGFGTQIAGDPANASSSLISAGIVTAAQFFGDGSNLEGVASAGLGTAVDDTKDSIGQNIYYTNDELSIYENTTVNAPSTSDVAYTQYAQVTVESGKELIIADGDTFIPDVLGIGTGLQANAGGAGNGLFGTVYADNIENVAGRGGPNLPLGMTVSGVSTFSGNVSIGGTLTYEDVTNVDSVGLVTAGKGIKVTAGGIDVTAGGLDIAGISTFSGQVNINGTANQNGELKIIPNGSAVYSHIRLRNAADSQGASITAHVGSALFVDSGTNGNINYRANGNGEHLWQTAGSEKLRIGNSGQIGIGGANYGSSGQVLTSQGASAAPQWATASSAGVNWVSGYDNPNSSYITFTGLTTSNVTQYKFVWNGISNASSNPSRLQFEIQYGGSTWFSTADYRNRVEIRECNGNGATVWWDANKDCGQIAGNESNVVWSGELILPMPPSNESLTNGTKMCYGRSTGNQYNSTFYVSWTNLDIKQNYITGVRFRNNSGTNLGETGRMDLYKYTYT